MKTNTCFLVVATLFLLFCKMTFAIPSQEDFYHNYYKIESKGFSGNVLRRISQSPTGVYPTFGEAVSLSNSYDGSSYDQWKIAPIYPGSSEFYIINKATGNPLMIDGNGNIKCNTSGNTEDSQRFVFQNVNGDYFQIRSASTAGCFYKKQYTIYDVYGNTIGYYYTLYYSTVQKTDDYSYFKLTSVGDISSSDNITFTNLVEQPDLKFNITAPPEVTSFTASVPQYSNETVIGESWIPFTLVNDPSYSRSIQVTQYPFYKMIRTQAWEKTEDHPYEPGEQENITFKKYQGVSTEQKQTTQTTLDQTWTLSGSAGFNSDAVKVTLGASYSNKLTYKYYR